MQPKYSQVWLNWAVSGGEAKRGKTFVFAAYIPWR